MQTFYYDVTKLIGSQLYTGVQRVVRNITLNAMKLSAEFGVQVIPVVAVDGTFHQLSRNGLETLVNGKMRPGTHVTGSGRLADFSKKLLSLSSRAYIWIQNRQFNSHMRRNATELYDPQPLSFGVDDTVILLDSFWGGSSAIDASTKAVGEGTRLVVVIYDMIPVTHPDLMTRVIASAYPKALQQAANNASGILTISKHCANAVESFLQQKSRVLPVRHFYLGHDLGGSTEQIDGSFPHGLWDNDDPVYLMVGTLEPRKGHACVLDAFEELWQHGGRQKLLLIGKVGWKIDKFVARCERHPERNTKLFLAHNASDGMLQFSIQHAEAAIIASTIEGFGLPMVETLAAGLPVFASDIEVFQEIAGNSAKFFKCNDARSLVQAIREYEDAPEFYRKAASEFSWINWENSARQFLEQVMCILDGKPEPQTNCSEAALNNPTQM